jgi:hypothetical protein
MVSLNIFRKLAQSLPETTEEPHFEKTSFRVHKKIFATYDSKNNRASLKLSQVDQHIFSSIDRKIIYPVDNKWGIQGWTLIELEKVRKDIFEEVLKKAYCTVAPKKLAEMINTPRKN